MASDSITRWLKRKSRIETLVDFFFGGVLIICSLILIVLTWGSGYVVAWLFQSVAIEIMGASVDFREPNQHVFNAIFASLVLVIIFAVHFSRQREMRGDWTDQVFRGDGSFFPRAMKISIYSAGQLFGRILDDRVLAAPRLSCFTATLLARAMRLWRLDYQRCGQILDALARRGRRISFAELETIVPDANRFHVFDQLRDIDGVVFLPSDPAGVSLTQDLRVELNSLPLRTETPPPPRPEFRAPPKPPEIELPDELSQCFYLLGIPPNATREQIRDAYRRKIKECHPDRFAQLSRDWQKLAEERSRQINRAYEIICKAP